MLPILTITFFQKSLLFLFLFWGTFIESILCDVSYFAAISNYTTSSIKRNNRRKVGGKLGHYTWHVFKDNKKINRYKTLTQIWKFCYTYGFKLDFFSQPHQINCLNCKNKLLIPFNISLIQVKLFKISYKVYYDV